MKSNAIYTTSDAGLNRFFGKIYGLDFLLPVYVLGNQENSGV